MASRESVNPALALVIGIIYGAVVVLLVSREIKRQQRLLSLRRQKTLMARLARR